MRILILLIIAVASFVFWVDATMTINMPDQMVGGGSRLVFVIIEMFKIMLGG